MKRLTEKDIEILKKMHPNAPEEIWKVEKKKRDKK